MTDLEKKQQEYIEVYQVQTNNLLEENLVLEKRVEELEKALRLIAEHPVDKSRQWEIACKEMKKIASAALGDQT